MCDLLRAFPEWEAIKVIHTSKNGRDSIKDCTSQIDAELNTTVSSGRRETCLKTEDAGLYWNAGATNVHVVEALNDELTDQALLEAVGRVAAPGVFIESNGFGQSLSPALMFLVAPPDGSTLSPAARQTIKSVSAIYIHDPGGESERARQRFAFWLRDSSVSKQLQGIPVFTPEELPELVALVWAAQLDHQNREAEEQSWTVA